MQTMQKLGLAAMVVLISACQSLPHEPNEASEINKVSYSFEVEAEQLIFKNNGVPLAAVQIDEVALHRVAYPINDGLWYLSCEKEGEAMSCMVEEPDFPLVCTKYHLKLNRLEMVSCRS